MKEVVVVNGVRTAIGTFGSSLKDTPVVQLGALVINGVLKKSKLRPLPSDKMLQYAPKPLQGKGLIDLEKNNQDWDASHTGVQVDEVIMGNVLQSGQGQNTARQAMIRAGISKETSAFTINKVCASGLKAVALGAQAIQLDQAEVVIAGGMDAGAGSEGLQRPGTDTARAGRRASFPPSDAGAAVRCARRAHAASSRSRFPTGRPEAHLAVAGPG